MTDPGGVGSLTARDDRGEAALIELAKVVVNAEPAGDYARVAIEHHFLSRATAVQEGTFRFPLPEAAVLTGLSMLVDGKLVEGELVEREKARRVYQDIVDSMQDPALLEWEHGSTFKMRVFPIEPGQPKVVTIRYLVPLTHKQGKLFFSQGSRQAGASGALPELTLRWAGKVVFSERQVSTGRVIDVPADEPGPVLREERADGVYTALHVRPDWSQVPVEPRIPPKHWIFVVDTSRSSLEERKLQLEVLRSALGELGPGERFSTFTSDLEVRAEPKGMVPASQENRAAALAFVNATEPDGATHLSRLFETLAEQTRGLSDVAVVYIGDCEPTWGVVKPAALRELATRSLGKATFNPIVIGAAVDTALAQELADSTSGRWLRASQPEQVSQFMRRLRQPGARLASVMVSAAPGATVFPEGKMALEKGEELVLMVKTPPGQEAAGAVRVQAKSGNRTLDLLPRAPALNSSSVAQRFGARWVQALERAGAPQEQVVSASLQYGVLSKYTAFLVLENEEAYARYAIERKAAQAADAPRVTGGDLNSLNGDGASLSLNRIQPGDPEVIVEAAADCQSVTVVFPFGESKRALFDPHARNGRGAWMVRFLVDRDTPEGVYDAIVHIVHRDGTRELRKVSYTVDHTPPTLKVELRRRGAGFEVMVTQAGPAAERDLRRVEVRTPDGRVLELTPLRWAEFRGLFQSRAAASKSLRVVGFDQALNHGSIEVELP